MTSVAPSTPIDRAAARRRFRRQLASTSATLSLLTLGVVGLRADGPSSQSVLPVESRTGAGVQRLDSARVQVAGGGAWDPPAAHHATGNAPTQEKRIALAPIIHRDQ